MRRRADAVGSGGSRMVAGAVGWGRWGVGLTARVPSPLGVRLAGRVRWASTAKVVCPATTRLPERTRAPSVGSGASSTVVPLVVPRSRTWTPSRSTVSSTCSRERASSATRIVAASPRPMVCRPGVSSRVRPASGPLTDTRRRGARLASVAAVSVAPMMSSAPSRRGGNPSGASGARVSPRTLAVAAACPVAASRSPSVWCASARTSIVSGPPLPVSMIVIRSCMTAP